MTTGGASVGEYDLVQRALAAEGLDLSFWRVALRPGRPMMHGRLGAMQVLGLPGNPVSSYVCAFLFLVPLIRRLSGRADVEHVAESARLGRDLPANDERADYLRATLSDGPDGPVATPLPAQDSSLMAPLAKADCLLIREPHAPAASAGSPCVILKLAPLAAFRLFHFKLNGCGTHMEQIVSVHDLFLTGAAKWARPRRGEDRC